MLMRSGAYGWLTQLLLIMLYLPPSLSYAQLIELPQADGIVLSADYQKGDADKPVILLMHGFLQTRESRTVAKLYTALADSGYSVLSPTLSLGLSSRNQSLACEAIHTHSMQSDIAEIDIWLSWLLQNTSGNIVFVGHSAGNIHLLAHIEKYSHDKIKQAIFVSLGPYGESVSSYETIAQADEAKALLKQKKANELRSFGLSFCKEYITTPANYLSYYEWQAPRVLNVLNKLPISVSVIVGSNDKRLGETWLSQLRDKNIHVLTVDGAGHFFDDAYEFDLQDAIESVLSAE